MKKYHLYTLCYHRISYHGSWYRNQKEDTWTTAPTVYLPRAEFGKGEYNEIR